MKHIRILTLAVAVAGTVGLAGCLPDEETKVYTGDTVVEFGPQQSRSTSYVFSVSGDQSNYFYRRAIANPTAAQGTVRDSVEVQVVTAAGRSAPLDVNFALDASGVNSAPAGTAYTLVTTSPVTIPAGSYSAKIYFDVTRRATLPSPRDTIRFVLNDGTGYSAAKNQRRFRIVIQ